MIISLITICSCYIELNLRCQTIHWKWKLFPCKSSPMFLSTCATKYLKAPSCTHTSTINAILRVVPFHPPCCFPKNTSPLLLFCPITIPVQSMATFAYCTYSVDKRTSSLNFLVVMLYLHLLFHLVMITLWTRIITKTLISFENYEYFFSYYSSSQS